MTVQTVEQIEMLSEADLENLQLLPEELAEIESELYPDLENISLEEVAQECLPYFYLGKGDVRRMSAGMEELEWRPKLVKMIINGVKRLVGRGSSSSSSSISSSSSSSGRWDSGIGSSGSGSR